MPKVCRSVLLPDFAFSWDSNHSPHQVVLPKGFHSSYVLFGEKTTCRIVLSCFVIVIGYALGIGGEINFSLKGTLFGLGASIVGAFYTILLKYYLSYVMPDRWELTFYNNFNSCLVMPLLIYVVLLQPFYVQLNGEVGVLKANVQNINPSYFITIFLCSRVTHSSYVAGLVGLFVGITTYLQIQYTSSLSHNISGVMKNCIQVIATGLFECSRSLEHGSSTPRSR